MSENTNSKKKRIRSPAYPAFGLRNCIPKAVLLYEAEDKHFVPIDALAEYWKYKTNNSVYTQYLSALKQFGLLEEQGSKENRRFRLTEMALDMLVHEEGSEQWTKCVQTAALNPRIHNELWSKYEGKLPPGNASIRVYLIRRREEGLFNKAHVDDFINQFRDTLAFANLSESDIIEDDHGEDDQNDTLKNGKEMSAVVAPKTPESTEQKIKQVTRDFPIPLMSGGIAVVKVPFPMSPADFTQLTSTLEAWKPALTMQQKKDDPPEEANSK